jgi:cephalosporin hydroxylase
MNRREFDELSRERAGNHWGDNEKETYAWWAQQHSEELWSLLELLQKNQVRTILEIGSSHGGALFFFEHILPPDGLLIGVEQDLNIAFSIQQNAHYDSCCSVQLLRQDSHDTSTVENIRKILGNRPVDFLFVDGDHSYEGCKKDLDMYSEFVKDGGGIIGFHDVAIDERVKKVFDEVSLEKVLLPVHFMGIGLLFK